MDKLTLCENDYNDVQYTTADHTVEDTSQVRISTGKEYEKLGAAPSDIPNSRTSNMKNAAARRIRDVFIVILVLAVIILSCYVCNIYTKYALVTKEVNSIKRGSKGALHFFVGAAPIKKNNYLTTIPRLHREFSLSFEFNASVIENDSKFYNMLHFTECDFYSVEQPGCRIVTVWLRNSTIRVEATISLKIRVFDMISVEANKWNKVEINQIRVGEDESDVFVIKINRQVIKRIKNTVPLGFNNVRVYASDPWFKAQQGQIRNLVIENL